MDFAWQIPTPIQVPDALREAVGGHPLVAEILYRRGQHTPEQAQRFLDWHTYTPAPATALPNMEKAAARIHAALAAGERIAVWGDFDVDGQTSTALLVSGLRELGADVMSYIPQRIGEGHGMHIASLTRLLEAGARLIITCDTGVDEHEAIDFANARGVDVIVTDHHKLPPTLPTAYAVVNPRMTPPQHPLRDLPGVGVAYKLMEALALPDASLNALLDLVALGIVADVAVQQGDTRYLLQRGLDVLRDTQRVGLQVMMELAEVNPALLNETDIAFRLAPRLNALGRLSDANPSTDLLTTRSPEQARRLANQLEGLNAERQRLSDEVWQGVEAAIEREPYLLKHAALVVAHEGWHTGVVGIVANRCVERYNRPTLLLSIGADGVARGSARSVAGVDITDAIAANEPLLLGFGGHSMAAGAALSADNIEAFRRGLSAAVRTQQPEMDIAPTLHIDAELPFGALDLALVEQLQRLAPFGAGNPPLVFATRGLTLTARRQLGREGKHYRLTAQDDGGATQQILYWNAENIPVSRFDLAYTLRENTFRGVRELVLEWVAAQGGVPIEDAQTVKRPQPMWIDRRTDAAPLIALREILAQEGANVQVWAEVNAPPDVPALRRDALQPCEALVVWTAPPSARVWDAVLLAAMPQRVYLLGQLPLIDALTPFLERLSGLVKYALKAKDGRSTWTALAGALAADEGLVRLGLAWLVERGHIAPPLHLDDETLLLEVAREASAPNPDNNDLVHRIEHLLGEAAAYRRYWQRAEVEYL